MSSRLQVGSEVGRSLWLSGLVLGRRLLDLASVPAKHPAFAVFAVATLWALIITEPLAWHLGDEIYGVPGDATGAVSTFWWWGYALQHGKPILDNTLQGVPLGSEWDLIAFSPLPVLVFAPIDVILGPIASYNLLILSGFPLTAWATYLLARQLGATNLGAEFAGLALAFMPYHIEKAMAHGNQTHLEFLVGTMLFLVRWRQGGSWRNLIAAGVMAGLQAAFEPSVAYVMGFALIAFFCVSAAMPEAGYSWAGWVVRHVKGGALMTGIGALFVPAVILFLHRPSGSDYVSSLSAHVAHAESSGQAVYYSARLREYVLPWHANPLLPEGVKQWELQHLHGSNFTESSLFLGYTVLLFGLIGVVWARRSFPVALGVSLIGVGVVMSLPPEINVGPLVLPLPSHYLSAIITTFRVYARFAMMVQLGVCLLGGLGLAVVQARLKSRRLAWLLVVPFLLIAFEFNNIPPTHITKILPAPAEYVWLRDQPAGVVMEYPANAGTPYGQEVQIRQYMLYQMVHLHPTFLTEVTNGKVSDVAKSLEPYYAPGVAERLKSFGVRYVLVHRSDYIADGFAVPLDVAGLTYVTTLDGVDVYVVS